MLQLKSFFDWCSQVCRGHSHGLSNGTTWWWPCSDFFTPAECGKQSLLRYSSLFWISNKNSHKMSQDIRHETASQTNYQGQSFRQSNKAHFYDVGKLLGLNISTQMMGKPYSVAVASDRKVAKGKKQVPPMTVSWYRRKRRKESYMSYMFVCVCLNLHIRGSWSRSEQVQNMTSLHC